MPKTIIFIDSGDTLVDESSEVRDGRNIVQTASLIPGAEEMLRTLRREGYRIAMVADGYAESFRNIYRQHQMDDCFEQRIYSSDVGEEKPGRRMFLSAMAAMGLREEDKSRIIMVGNNIKRDVAGANRFGITSVLLDWTPRYPMQPEREDERPDYVIHTPMELVALVRRLEKERK